MLNDRPVTFDFGAFARFLHGWLTRIPWTPRRVAITTGFVIIYPLLQLCVWTSFALDALFFRRFREESVRAPLFIIGNFRSGTTFLHRLLAKDSALFTSMTLGEILFAPSVIQRRLAAALVALDRRLGRPVARLIARIEARWHAVHVMHRVSFGEPEEDEYLHLHIFSALTTGLSSGLLDLARPYAFFDSAIPAVRRDRIMGFYRTCIQRHLHAHQVGEKIYLAKNPALTPKLATLLAHFPDARIILLVRDPRETIPSFARLMDVSWDAVGLPPDPARANFLREMQHHWYDHPASVAATLPPEQFIVVKYSDLCADPAATVAGIYTQFSLPLLPEFAATLQNEAVAAREHRPGPTITTTLDGFDDVRARHHFP